MRKESTVHQVHDTDGRRSDGQDSQLQDHSDKWTKQTYHVVAFSCLRTSTSRPHPSWTPPKAAMIEDNHRGCEERRTFLQLLLTPVESYAGSYGLLRLDLFIDV